MTAFVLVSITIAAEAPGQRLALVFWGNKLVVSRDITRTNKILLNKKITNPNYII